MKLFSRTTTLCVPVVLLMLASAASAQWQKKPYSEWSEKDVKSVLNNSPWVDNLEVAATEKMMTATLRPGGPGGSDMTTNSNGRVAETSRVFYRVRLFSAKPTRQALCRLIELRQKGKVSDELAGQLKNLVDAQFKDYVVLTLVVDTAESANQAGPSAAMLAKQTTGLIKSETYLLPKGGERIFLEEYKTPGNDGFGARFVFPRNPGGKPLITPETGELLFHAKLVDGPTLSLRFKVKDMMWDGKLEY